MSDWRELAEWDWVCTASDDDEYIHAVASVDDPERVEEDWGGPGKTECGIADEWLHIPGLFTRMGSPRCPACCEATGMPMGEQSPKNIDQCRPVAERRIAALAPRGTRARKQMCECIAERRRTQGGRVVVEVWHIVAGPAINDATWRPILCGGINFPGHAREREPTCPECLALGCSGVQSEEADG